eukprot:gene24104-10197_t
MRGAHDTYKCGGDRVLKIWIERPNVQAAIHVPIGLKWQDRDGWANGYV